MRPGGSGAAETFEPRQIREEAAVRGSLWAPPGCLPGYVEIIKGRPQQDSPFCFAYQEEDYLESSNLGGKLKV
jgi:hypothetical protein